MDFFVATKSNLKNGQKPCGCSKHNWSNQQYLIKANRVWKNKDFIIYGVPDKFCGKRTKITLKCNKEGHEWKADFDKIIHDMTGCIKCRVDKRRLSEHKVIERCRTICTENNYEFIGFPDGYINASSKFEYNCSKHGLQAVRYSQFVNTGTRCKGCYEDNSRKINSRFHGWYPERAEEQDFLYVLDFDGQYIKVGRSFKISKRIRRLKTKSKINSIVKLRIFTATHKEIWDLEQELIEELTARGFWTIPSTWYSVETFENDCLYTLNKLLSGCGFDEIDLSKQ